jgi:hypothetical protein
VQRMFRRCGGYEGNGDLERAEGVEGVEVV